MKFNELEEFCNRHSIKTNGLTLYPGRYYTAYEAMKRAGVDEVKGKVIITIKQNHYGYYAINMLMGFYRRPAEAHGYFDEYVEESFDELKEIAYQTTIDYDSHKMVVNALTYLIIKQNFSKEMFNDVFGSEVVEVSDVKDEILDLNPSTVKIKDFIEGELLNHLELEEIVIPKKSGNNTGVIFVDCELAGLPDELTGNVPLYQVIEYLSKNPIEGDYALTALMIETMI